MQRVIQNLIGNVLKHGVDFFAVKVDSERIITFTNKVADVHGLDIGRLFDRFYTADGARTNQKTGLGLAIAKTIIKQLGGQIRAWLDDDLLHIEIKLPKR